MPTYEITDQKTGKVYEVTGSRPPTSAEAAKLVASMNGGAAPSTPSSAPHMYATPPAPEPSTWQKFVNAAVPEQLQKAIAYNLAHPDQALDPRNLPSQLLESVKAIPQTLAGIIQAPMGPAGEAVQASRRGDPIGAVAHGLNVALPLIGPMIDPATSMAGRGDVAGAVAHTFGTAAPFILPEVMPSRVGIPALFKNPNPVVADAVKFGQEAGIPVDAATATGSKTVKAVQYLADRTLGADLAARVLGSPEAAQTEALSRVGGQLAERAAPGAGAQTLETAGAGLRQALINRRTSFERAADTAYDELRALEADPANQQPGPPAPPVRQAGFVPAPTSAPTPTTIGPTVNVKDVKAALAPVLDVWNQSWPETQRMGSPAYTALKSLVSGVGEVAPNEVPWSVAERNLSKLKEEARTPSGKRNASQGLAAHGVGLLQKAVDTSVGEAPGAIEALRAGRSASKASWDIHDLVTELNQEPVQAARSILQRGDASVEQLRSIQQEAPQVMPILGRAYFEDLVTPVQAGGSFDGTQGLWTRWQKLGPSTKAILSGHEPGLAKDLDRFFLLVKKMGENPNPSGTGHIVSMLAQGEGFLHLPIQNLFIQLGGGIMSRLLHSRAGVRLLTEGLTAPVRGTRTASQAAALAELSRLAEQHKQEQQQEPQP